MLLFEKQQHMNPSQVGKKELLTHFREEAKIDKISYRLDPTTLLHVTCKKLFSHMLKAQTLLRSWDCLLIRRVLPYRI